LKERRIVFAVKRLPASYRADRLIYAGSAGAGIAGWFDFDHEKSSRLDDACEARRSAATRRLQAVD